MPIASSDLQPIRVDGVDTGTGTVVIRDGSIDVWTGAHLARRLYEALELPVSLIPSTTRTPDQASRLAPLPPPVVQYALMPPERSARIEKLFYMFSHEWVRRTYFSEEGVALEVTVCADCGCSMADDEAYGPFRCTDKED